LNTTVEARIDAQITEDPMKRKVFLEGYDSHSLNTAIYFPEKVEEILGCPVDLDDPAMINRIKVEAEALRGSSKSITFGLQYLAGAANISKQLKCSKEEGQRIYDAYKEKYKESAQWVQANTNFAKANGYIDGAFGLKLRTPRINSSDSGVSSGEMRTLNNMRSQSYGMLMNVAAIAFQNQIEACDMVEDVVVFSTIHDALYMLIKDDPKTIKWVNDTLIEIMGRDFVENQVIHNEAELDIGYSWASQKTLKNNLSEEEIAEKLKELE